MPEVRVQNPDPTKMSEDAMPDMTAMIERHRTLAKEWRKEADEASRNNMPIFASGCRDAANRHDKQAAEMEVKS